MAQGVNSSKSNEEIVLHVYLKTGHTYAEAYIEFKVYYYDQKSLKTTKDDTFSVLDKLIIVGEKEPISNTKLTDLIKIKQKIESLPNLNYTQYKKLSFEEILNRVRCHLLR